MFDLDTSIVLLYLIILLVIALLQRTKKSSFKHFARITDTIKRNKLILVASIFASSIGGGTTFGISEKTFAGNIAHSYGLFLAIPVDFMIAFLIVPKLTKHYGAESIGDIVSYYYGNMGRYITGFATILVSIGLVATQISVSGRIFEYILEVNYIYGVIISYSVVIFYSTIGGLRSILYANQLQFFAILLAIPTVTIFGIYNIGFYNFIDQIPSEKIYFKSNPDLFTTTISAFLGFCVMNLFPTFIQRAMINSDYNVTKKAIYIKSFIYALFLIFITLNGIIAYIIFPEEKASLALPTLINHIIPTGIQGFVIVGLLAAVMSTADSDLNITSISLVKDFLKPIFKIEDQKKLLRIARLSNIILGSGAILIALCFDNVVDLVIFVAGYWGPVILVPLVFALHNKKIKNYQMLICSLLGITSFIIWESFYTTQISLKSVFVGTMTNLVCFLCFYYSRIFVR